MKTVKTIVNSFKHYQVLSVLALVISIGFSAQAQSYKTVAGSSLKVLGTSNLHDWEMVAQNVPAEAQLSFKGSEVQDITALSISLPVKNLKAKEDLMNSRAYKAMKADKFNTITFKLASAEIAQSTAKATGALTIAGVTKQVTLQGKITENADGSATITGSRKIKMSEFGITPPSFMLGALKVGDEVTVEYTLKLKK
ncbi:YceI-like domain-containing protein [Arcticibacter tournemirensis]|uniref:YceI family protein n=1 Tax=Arcticibacter tournemirensis TaxID=699437 RepID=A0A4Q0MFJ1_9SPHI|nr:YceI family protein [Arcticibacter tournemirensis]KAA8481688.1 YceI family protein [Arcticibacter tournemirensis]RXF71666.1 YceI family protein [Arcticibacter tournemirensis]TQM48911.1 YceI-like domain-containing protein [Arcticibacter tournemirensis]